MEVGGCVQVSLAIYFSENSPKPGVKINARPLARGEWKPRGMSRIFAEVVRRASWFFFFFFLDYHY